MGRLMITLMPDEVMLIGEGVKQVSVKLWRDSRGLDAEARKPRRTKLCIEAPIDIKISRKKTTSHSSDCICGSCVGGRDA